jgi:hypothetical protein
MGGRGEPCSVEPAVRPRQPAAAGPSTVPRGSAWMARRLGKGAGMGAPRRRHPWRRRRPWCTRERTARCLNRQSEWGGGARTSRRRLGHGMGTKRQQREAGTAATLVVGRRGRRVARGEWGRKAVKRCPKPLRVPRGARGPRRPCRAHGGVCGGGSRARRSAPSEALKSQKQYRLAPFDWV